MKRTLRKRAGLWELSVPLRAPVRGIWRYTIFGDAWGHLWKTGYPPGLPSEIKTAVRNAEPSPLGVEYLADIDDAVTAVKEFVPDVVLPAGEPKPRGSSLISRSIAAGLALRFGDLAGDPIVASQPPRFRSTAFSRGFDHSEGGVPHA